MDEYQEDEEGIVEPVVMAATWLAHQQQPIPFDPECVGYDDLKYQHYHAFETILTAMAPRLIADLDGAIWELHHRAYLRLGEVLQLIPQVHECDDAPADLIYATATAPYRTLPSGRRSLCPEALARKRQWYLRSRVAVADT